MQHDKLKDLSRRSFVARVSTGAAALVAVSTQRSGASGSTIDMTEESVANDTVVAASAQTAEPAIARPTSPPPWQLLKPLREGSELAEGWRIRELSEIAEGSCVLTLGNQSGRTSRLHICRNAGTPEGLVFTDRLDVVVMNGGRGDMPTEEGLGQAVAKVAHVLAANESAAGSVIAELMPQNQRLAMFADTARLR